MDVSLGTAHWRFHGPLKVPCLSLSVPIEASVPLLPLLAVHLSAVLWVQHSPLPSWAAHAVFCSVHNPESSLHFLPPIFLSVFPPRFSYLSPLHSCTLCLLLLLLTIPPISSTFSPLFLCLPISAPHLISLVSLAKSPTDDASSIIRGHEARSVRSYRFSDFWLSPEAKNMCHCRNDSNMIRIVKLRSGHFLVHAETPRVSRWKDKPGFGGKGWVGGMKLTNIISCHPCTVYCELPEFYQMMPGNANLSAPLLRQFQKLFIKSSF